MKHAYICWCRDSVHAEQLRRDTLAAHLAYVETIMDRVLIAGALRDEDNQISGSCLICWQKLFIHRSHLKNAKAHHLPVLGYILPLCFHLLVFRWFRCTHCGTPVRLKE